MNYKQNRYTLHWLVCRCISWRNPVYNVIDKWKKKYTLKDVNINTYHINCGNTPHKVLNITWNCILSLKMILHHIFRSRELLSDLFLSVYVHLRLLFIGRKLLNIFSFFSETNELTGLYLRPKGGVGYLPAYNDVITQLLLHFEHNLAIRYTPRPPFYFFFSSFYFNF